MQSRWSSLFLLDDDCEKEISVYISIRVSVYVEQCFHIEVLATLIIKVRDRQTRNIFMFSEMLFATKILLCACLGMMYIFRMCLSTFHLIKETASHSSTHIYEQLPVYMW